MSNAISFVAFEASPRRLTTLVTLENQNGNPGALGCRSGFLSGESCGRLSSPPAARNLLLSEPSPQPQLIRPCSSPWPYIHASLSSPVSIAATLDQCCRRRPKPRRESSFVRSGGIRVSPGSYLSGAQAYSTSARPGLGLRCSGSTALRRWLSLS